MSVVVDQEYRNASREEPTNTENSADSVAIGEGENTDVQPGCWMKFYNWLNNLFTMKQKTHLIVKWTLFGLGLILFSMCFVACCCCCSREKTDGSTETDKDGKARLQREGTGCKGFWLSFLFVVLGGVPLFCSVCMLWKKMWLGSEEANEDEETDPLLIEEGEGSVA